MPSTAEVALTADAKKTVFYENYGLALYDADRHEDAHAAWQKMMTVGDDQKIALARRLLAQYP